MLRLSARDTRTRRERSRRGAATEAPARPHVGWIPSGVFDSWTVVDVPTAVRVAGDTAPAWLRLTNWVGTEVVEFTPGATLDPWCENPGTTQSKTAWCGVTDTPVVPTGTVVDVNGVRHWTPGAPPVVFAEYR